MPYFLWGSLDSNRLLYAIRTPIVWHIFGAYCLQIWGVGVVRMIFKERRAHKISVLSSHRGVAALLWGQNDYYSGQMITCRKIVLSN